MEIEVRLALVILAVSDLDRATRFYQETFGWTQIVATPVYVEFTVPDKLRLGLYERASFSRNTTITPIEPTESGITGTEIYLYTTNFDLLMERLKHNGARQLSPLQERSWGEEVVYFADPDGNVLALARPLQKSI